MRKIRSSKKHEIKISACYIVKNEESTLPRSIDSLKAAVDEIIVVDTGSNDSTIEIAESYGAKVIKTDWNDDFSAPRNLAIENATGNWVIMIDADEFFISPKKVRAAVLSLSKFDAIFVPRIDIDEDNNNQELNRDVYLRAFRNASNLRYRGRIHENLENINGNGLNYTIAGEELTLHHTGYSTTKAESKLRRNLAIINAEVEQVGLLPRHHIALLDCYYALDDYEQALYHARALFESGIRPVTGLEIYYRKTLAVMRHLRCNLDDILQVLNDALSHFPTDKEFLMQHKLISEYIEVNHIEKT